MARRNLLKLYKENGAVQRSDNALTSEVAGALAQLVLSGEKLFPGKGTTGHIELQVEGQEAPILLSRSTLKSWIQRGNVLSDGNSLRDILDKAKEAHRARKRKEIDDMREEMIDAKFNRVLSMRTKEPVMGRAGVIKHPETGKPLMKENTNLLSEQMRNVRFLAERQFPDRYGKKDKTENKHLVFSLSDLRREYEAQKSRAREGS